MRDFLSFLTSKIPYWTLLFVTAAISSYTFLLIENIPKPETVSEMISFLFNDQEGYFKTFIFNLVTSLLLIVVGVCTIINAFKLRQDFHFIVTLIIGLFGFALIIFGFYFLSYFILLLIPILIIGGLLIIFANSRR